MTAEFVYFGALWVLPAAGFVAVAIGLLGDCEWWKPIVVASSLVSLALTGLDWNVAFMGAIVDMAVLALLWLGPTLAA